MVTTVGAIIAVLLLGLYVYAISVLVAKPGDEPTQQVATILSLVGGLVSALVVAVLAARKPDQVVSAVFLPAGASSAGLSMVIWAYLFSWLGCGMVLLICWMRTPVPAKTLSAAATSWLGLAIAAGYAYFGLEKP